MLIAEKNDELGTLNAIRVELVSERHFFANSHWVLLH